MPEGVVAQETAVNLVPEVATLAAAAIVVGVVLEAVVSRPYNTSESPCRWEFGETAPCIATIGIAFGQGSFFCCKHCLFVRSARRLL